MKGKGLDPPLALHTTLAEGAIAPLFPEIDHAIVPGTDDFLRPRIEPSGVLGIYFDGEGRHGACTGSEAHLWADEDCAPSHRSFETDAPG